MKYKSNKEYGLIYEEGKDISEYLNDDVKFLSWELKKRLLQKKSRKVIKLVYHPVGTHCLGDCEFCFNHGKNVSYMKPGRVSEVFKILEDNNLLHETGIRVMDFTGGEAPLHPKIKDIIEETIQNNFNRGFTDPIDARFTVAFMLNDRMFNNFVNLLEELINDNRIKSVHISMSIDPGTIARRSSALHLDEIKLRERTEYLLNKFKEHLGKKFSAIIRLGISRTFDPARLDEELKKLSKYDCEFILYTIYDKSMENTPVGLFTSAYEICLQHFQYYCYDNQNILSFSNKPLEKGNNLDHLGKTFLLELEPGIYRQFNHKCGSFSQQVHFDQEYFYTCWFGNGDKEENVKSAFFLNSENEFHKLFINLPDQCRQCDVVAFCSLCGQRRHILNCEAMPNVKESQRIRWDAIMNHQEKWVFDDEI